MHIVFDVLTHPYTKVFELFSIYQSHILNFYYQFRVRATIVCILVHILCFRSIDIESYFFQHLLEDVDLFCCGLFCSQLRIYIQWSLVSWDNERLGWPITCIRPENVRGWEDAVSFMRTDAEQSPFCSAFFTEPSQPIIKKYSSNVTKVVIPKKWEMRIFFIYLFLFFEKRYT